MSYSQFGFFSVSLGSSVDVLPQKPASNQKIRSKERFAIEYELFSNWSCLMNVLSSILLTAISSEYRVRVSPLRIAFEYRWPAIVTSVIAVQSTSARSVYRFCKPTIVCFHCVPRSYLTVRLSNWRVDWTKEEKLVIWPGISTFVRSVSWQFC